MFLTLRGKPCATSHTFDLGRRCVVCFYTERELSEMARRLAVKEVAK